MRKIDCVCAGICCGLLAVAFPGGSLGMHASEGPELRVINNNVVSASIRGSMGILQGEARETVYNYDLGYRYKLSELIWDLKDVGMAGAVGTFSLYKRFHLNIGFWGAFTKGSGQMEDYDWFLPGEAWTDWSLSDVDVSNAYQFDVNLSADAYKKKGLAVRGLLGYKRDHWEWKDYGIRHIYSMYGFRDDVGWDNGATGIEYEQTFDIPYIGVGLGYEHKGFSVDGYFNYSPFVYAKDKDLHVFRDIQWEETFKNGDYYGLGVQGKYTFKSGLFLSLALDYQDIPEIIGDTTMTSNGYSVDSSDTAGLSNHATMLSASVGYVF